MKPAKLKIPPKSEFFRMGNEKIEFRSPDIESLSFKRGKKLIAMVAIYEWDNNIGPESVSDSIKQIEAWKKWGELC